MDSLRRKDAELEVLLDCLAQTHRRERRALRDAEAARRKAAATQAALAGLRRVPGLASRLLSALRRKFVPDVEHQPTPESDPAFQAIAGRPADISFQGRAKIAIPLTLESQTVVVPPAAVARELWLTTAGHSQPAPTALAVRRRAANDPDGRADTYDDIVQLTTARPHRLVELDAGASGFLLELGRAEGNFCVLVLELCDAGSNRAAALEALAGRSARPEDGRNEPIPAPGPRQGETAEPPAQQLDQKLWGGYARYAEPALERLKLDPYARMKERVAAAWYLTRWHYAEENYLGALANIEFAKTLPTTLTARVPLAEAQCLMHLGRCEEALELVRGRPDNGRELDFRLLESTAARNACLAQGTALEEAESRQLNILNDVLIRSGLAPLRKQRTADPLSLANLACDARAALGAQSSKVSVIVPAFDCETTIGWVLESLLAQTWRNLEIIVVNDCSSDATAEIVEEIARREPRLRLVRLEENGGAYPARNAGARLATGDLITVHDSDDWSHAQRIEMQVRALEEYAYALGVKSHWLRVSEQLEAVGRWMPFGSILEHNYSSFLFRREVLDELGLWDDVRISGDGEFMARFRAVYGAESIVTLPRNYLLALSLTRQDSLTQSESTHLKTLYYGLRRSYRDAYCWWHRELDREGGLPFDPKREPRAFPVPLGNVPLQPRKLNFDVVVVADFAARGTALESALSYLDAAANCGLRAAVFDWRHYASRMREPLEPDFYRACLRSAATILSPGDSVGCRFVLIADPSVLGYLIDPRPDIDAERVIVTVEHGMGPDAAARIERFDPRIAVSHLREIFGTEGDWVAASAETAERMRQDARFPSRAPAIWRPVVDAEALSQRALEWRGGSGVPILGRRIVSELDGPSSLEVFRTAYGADQACRTRFHGGAENLSRLLTAPPENWALLSTAEIDRIDFISGLDFYVHFPHELRAGEINRSLLEAMALGVPVVAPPRLAETFGDALAYASPVEVMDTVHRLWSTENDYLRLAERARAFAREHHGLADFAADRLNRLGEPESADGPAVTSVQPRCA